MRLLLALSHLTLIHTNWILGPKVEGITHTDVCDYPYVQLQSRHGSESSWGETQVIKPVAPNLFSKELASFVTLDGSV